MKYVFPIQPKVTFFDRQFWLMILMMIFLLFIIFPFLSWMLKNAQPFSLNLIAQFIQEQQYLEIPRKDLGFFVAYSLTYILIGILHSHMKLVITPEKIYSTFLNIPIGTIIKRSSIDYCQMGIVQLELTRFAKMLNRPLFKSKSVSPQEKLYFFPLRNLQLNLEIKQLAEEDKTQVIELLKKYYHFQEGVQDISLPSKEANALVREQLSIKISPRIAYLLGISVLIGAVGIFLEIKSPFFLITNYPTFPIICTLVVVLFIPSFLWIRKDIQQLAWFGALLSGVFISIALYVFLLPILHGYYTQNFGKNIQYKAKLVEITTRNQVWQPLNGDAKFYLRTKYPKYNANLKLNQSYVFSAHYHWHNYTLNKNAFLEAKPLPIEIAQKKDR